MTDTSLEVSLISRALVDDIGINTTKCKEKKISGPNKKIYITSAFARIGWHKKDVAKVSEETFYVSEDLEAPVILGRPVATAQGHKASTSSVQVAGLDAQSSGM